MKKKLLFVVCMSMVVLSGCNSISQCNRAKIPYGEYVYDRYTGCIYEEVADDEWQPTGRNINFEADFNPGKEKTHVE